MLVVMIKEEKGDYFPGVLSPRNRSSKDNCCRLSVTVPTLVSASSPSNSAHGWQSKGFPAPTNVDNSSEKGVCSSADVTLRRVRRFPPRSHLTIHDRFSHTAQRRHHCQGTNYCTSYSSPNLKILLAHHGRFGSHPCSLKRWSWRCLWRSTLIITSEPRYKPR
jgi:hypothetical protein